LGGNEPRQGSRRSERTRRVDAGATAADASVDAEPSPQRHDGAARSGPEGESAGSRVRQDVEAVARDAGMDTENAMRHARRLALIRHAHACDEILETKRQGIEPTIDQRRELGAARRVFEEVRPFGWQDAEAAYNKDNSLAREAGDGKVQRAIRNSNPCWKTASANWASTSTQAAGSARLSPSPMASISVEEGGLGCRTILFAAFPHHGTAGHVRIGTARFRESLCCFPAWGRT